MFFIHKHAVEFEEFGGIYIPYGTLEEAERQAAWDLRDTNGDAEAARLLGIFEAEYGGHEKIGPRIFDHDKPFGHLDPEARKKVHSPSQVAKLSKKHIAAILEEQKVGLEEHLLMIDRAIKEGRGLKASVPGNAYCIVSGGTSTGGAIALTAATAKTVLGLASGSANAPSIVEAAISFDGVTSSAVPVLCEAVSGTNATNAPGTASTSMTPKQTRGVVSSSQATAAYNWTTEPTVLEVYKKRLLTPYGGLLVLQAPLGREATGQVSASTQFKFMGIRLTAPATVNCHVDAEYEE